MIETQVLAENAVVNYYTNGWAELLLTAYQASGNAAIGSITHLVVESTGAAAASSGYGGNALFFVRTSDNKAVIHAPSSATYGWWGQLLFRYAID